MGTNTKRIQQRPGTFDILVEEYMKKMYFSAIDYVRKHGFCRTDAEDIVHHTLEVALSKPAAWHCQSLEALARWMYKALHYSMLEIRRDNATYILSLDESSNGIISSDPTVDIFRRHDSSIRYCSNDREETQIIAQLTVEQIFSQLTPEEIDLVGMRYYEKMSYREIAQLRGKSEVSVRTRLCRLGSRVRQLLTDTDALLTHK